MTRRPRHPLWGLMAEFDSPTALVAAAHKTREPAIAGSKPMRPFRSKS